jgi:TonB family protein
MKYLLILLVALGSSAYTNAQTSATATPVAGATSGSREQDKLKGPVRRVRVETSNIVTRNGKQVELPKSLLEVSTYNAAGAKIDSVVYPVEGGSAAGNEEYKYDDRFNPIEMTLRGNDGSVIAKEKYTYEFDEFGNWKKMTTAVAVYENGAVSYEPTRVTYRTLTYYYGPPLPKPGVAAATVAAPSAKRTDAEAAPLAEKPVPTQLPGVVSAPPATVAEEPAAVRTSAEAEPSKEVVKIPVIRIPEDVLRKAAIEIPEPQYPATAELARASGPVQVELMIDQNGMVTIARATSGNPMLFEAATSAASKARFLMSAFSNQPTRAYSVLTYNFARPVELTSVPGNTSPAITEAAPPPASNNARVADPKSFADHFNKGMASLAAAKYKDAVDSLTQAVAVNPDDAIAFTKLGLAYSALGEHKPAITAFKQAIKLNRAFVDADAYFHLGVAYLAQSDYASAIDPLKQALYGVKARQLEDRTKSIGGPSETEIHDALGRAYYGTGSYRQAVTAFETAVRLKPDFASAHYGLGLSYLEVGDKRAAEKQEQLLRKLKSRLADRLAGILIVPAGQKNRVF